jgi:glucose-6-phosphate 1-dehydrogenase
VARSRSKIAALQPAAGPASVSTTGQQATMNPGTSTLRKNSTRVGPGYPQVVVLFGATGDLSRRKLLPGLFHLINAGFIPGCRIVGVSLDEIDADGFRTIARQSLDQFLTRKFTQAEWEAFSAPADRET